MDNNIDYDYERLRKDLIEYLGTAAKNYNLPAYMDLLSAQSATNSTLKYLALINHFDLSKYEKGFTRKLF